MHQSKNFNSSHLIKSFFNIRTRKVLNLILTKVNLLIQFITKYVFDGFSRYQNITYTTIILLVSN